MKRLPLAALTLVTGCSAPLTFPDDQTNSVARAAKAGNCKQVLDLVAGIDGEHPNIGLIDHILFETWNDDAKGAAKIYAWTAAPTEPSSEQAAAQTLHATAARMADKYGDLSTTPNLASRSPELVRALAAGLSQQLTDMLDLSLLREHRFGFAPLDGQADQSNHHYLRTIAVFALLDSDPQSEPAMRRAVEKAVEALADLAADVPVGERDGPIEVQTRLFGVERLRAVFDRASCDAHTCSGAPTEDSSEFQRIIIAALLKRKPELRGSNPLIAPDGRVRSRREWREAMRESGQDPAQALYEAQLGDFLDQLGPGMLSAARNPGYVVCCEKYWRCVRRHGSPMRQRLNLFHCL